MIVTKIRVVVFMQKTNLYSGMQIAIAAFLGSFLAGAFLLALNVYFSSLFIKNAIFIFVLSILSVLAANVFLSFYMPILFSAIGYLISPIFLLYINYKLERVLNAGYSYERSNFLVFLICIFMFIVFVFLSEIVVGLRSEGVE
jgi:hypothetical protein